MNDDIERKPDESIAEEPKPPEPEPEPMPPEPEPPKPEAPKPKAKRKPKVAERIRGYMASETRNEYGVLRDRIGDMEPAEKEAWLKQRMKEKLNAYHDDPATKDAYDNWKFYHGGSKRGE